MCSTSVSSVSTFLTHNESVLTERCGEVYCSQNVETFFINCLRCSQEFNLLSCSLFIKHIKKCLPTVLHTNQEAHNLTNSAEDDLENVDYAIQQTDPLITIKQEDVKEKEETNDAAYEDDAACEDVEYLSDYQNEDDLPLDKLGRRKIVEGIISEYKKHPLLWDTKLGCTVKRADKIRAYRKIRKAVNSKYKTNFTYIELRNQIQNLRCGYRRVLRKKQVFEKLFPDGTKQFNPMLWFFDKISFIEETNQDYKVDLTQNSETEHEGSAYQNERDGNESSDSSSDPPIRALKKTKRERPSTKILNEPDIVSEIINQYKQYPFLWDQTSPLYSDRYARKDALRKITKSINQKFNKNVTDKEIRQQIVNLRCVYRREQRKKHNPNYRVSLWYYDELSFIDNKANFMENVSDEANEPMKHEEPDNEETFGPNTHSIDSADNYEILKNESNTECDDDNENDPADVNALSCRKKNNKIILSLIEEYKKHPCLWNNYQYKVMGRLNRYDAVDEIMCVINAKHSTSFTKTEIRNKLVQLRSSYRRVLRNKEAFEKKHANAKRKFFPQLWYFDKMTFIGGKDSDFPISRRKKKKSGEVNELEIENRAFSDEELQSDDPSECDSIESEVQRNLDEHTSQSEPQRGNSTESLRTTITKNKSLLRAVIEEYKSKPCLWEVNSDTITRERNLNEICDVINQKFNTNLDNRNLDREMSVLISLYKRMLRRKESSSKLKAWYADLLSFISSTHNSQSSESCDTTEQRLAIPGKKPVAAENNSSGDEEVYQSGSPVNTKEIVFKIIELYRSATVLWDTNHPQHTLRTERKKCIEAIIDKLKQEHNCHLTVEEFRYQIRFLKKSYFRAVRQEAMVKQSNPSSSYTIKPFFFEEISFLEPFADKKPVTAPDLQIVQGKQETEDFTFLSENKSLMISFIQLYKANACLWDHNHKDRNNPSAHAVAYGDIINMFKQNGEDLTEKRVLSAISFLHSTVVNTQKTFALNDKNNANKSPVWFYEHLQFLGRIPRLQDKYCAHCNQHFHSLVEYERHKIDIAGDYPYKCEICNAGFVSRSKYAYHQITHKEPHKCDQCDFQAFDKHNFNVHMRRHKGIHLFRCNECDKGFVTSTELSRHVRMHTGEKAYICEICGKALVANAEYHNHMKRHRNQRDYKCQICDNAFFTAKTLKCHMESHSTERKHVCEICGSSFKRKKTLLQHKALHLEQKKHECNICGKLFAQRAGVYSHMKSHGQIINK